MEGILAPLVYMVKILRHIIDLTFWLVSVRTWLAGNRQYCILADGALSGPVDIDILIGENLILRSLNPAFR